MKKELKNAFEQFDEEYEVMPPNKPTLSIMLDEKVSVHKQKQKNELILFMFIAALIITLLLTILMKLPILYVMIQVLGIAAVPIFVWHKKKKRNGEDYLI
ncbi:MAG: DUF5345 family protein [Bacillus sp. (in: firmicutes)]